MSTLDPHEYIITRKRKRYKFALFYNHPLCFEQEGWSDQPSPHIIELGAGTGLFAVELATAFPGKQVLAIDVKADRLITGAKEAAKRGLTNVQFLRAHIDQLGGKLQPRSVEKLWITFPDPHPKERSAKHRLTHAHFLQYYQTLLAPSGALYFKTDSTDLFHWSLETLVREGWQIQELSFDLHASDLSSTYRLFTTYETKFTAEGLSTYFVKVAYKK
jgi:tRNA (guanine-N7-)-methyltransferase